MRNIASNEASGRTAIPGVVDAGSFPVWAAAGVAVWTRQQTPSRRASVGDDGNKTAHHRTALRLTGSCTQHTERTALAFSATSHHGATKTRRSRSLSRANLTAEFAESAEVHGSVGRPASQAGLRLSDRPDAQPAQDDWFVHRSDADSARRPATPTDRRFLSCLRVFVSSCPSWFRDERASLLSRQTLTAATNGCLMVLVRRR